MGQVIWPWSESSWIVIWAIGMVCDYFLAAVVAPLVERLGAAGELESGVVDALLVLDRRDRVADLARLSGFFFQVMNSSSWANMCLRTARKTLLSLELPRKAQYKLKSFSVAESSLILCVTGFPSGSTLMSGMVVLVLLDGWNEGFGGDC